MLSSLIPHSRRALPRLAVLAGAGLALLLAVASCGGGSSGPTVVPTPIATPTPVPTPTPDPNVPPAGSGCGKPYPPPITRFNVKVLYKSKEFHTVDSSPLVGPNGEYCASIGFPDRTICTVRPEGTDDRLACELWRSGTAKDTGKPGPTWTFVNPDGTGTYCTGPTSPCEPHENGPFTLKAFRGGTYRVCTEAGACGEVYVDRTP
jgi:hypothetical protein